MGLLLLRCLCEQSERATAADLLQHPLITSYSAKASKRQKELDAAVAALKTHIDIHKGKGQRERERPASRKGMQAKGHA